MARIIVPSIGYAKRKMRRTRRTRISVKTAKVILVEGEPIDATVEMEFCPLCGQRLLAGNTKKEINEIERSKQNENRN
jgi:hypothetical protein